jgi:medium-chain acyl-CoA synthetase
MAHFHQQTLLRPEKFNFAMDVVDYWAAQPGNLKAMFWVSQDQSQTRSMTFEYFSRQSHRISCLFEQLGIKKGETMTIILPRVPAW